MGAGGRSAPRGGERSAEPGGGLAGQGDGAVASARRPAPPGPPSLVEPAAPLAPSESGEPSGPAEPSQRSDAFDWEALDRHLARVRGCRLCPGVEPPPVAARPETPPRILLCGQAPGPREVVLQRPFAYTAGSRLFAWFARLGVDEEEVRKRVYFAAVLRCFPGRAPQGGDRVPAPPEIANCSPYLEAELALLRPDLVLPVGQLAISRFLPEPGPLHERVGRLFPVTRGDLDFGVLPLPHPSGRSTWLVKAENQALLDRALGLLAGSAAWRDSFGKRGAEA